MSGTLTTSAQSTANKAELSKPLPLWSQSRTTTLTLNGVRKRALSSGQLASSIRLKMEPTPEDKEISQIMREHALLHIKQAAEHFGQLLVFSESSIKEVYQSILHAISKMKEDIEAVKITTIAYLGETFIRNLGGHRTNHPQFGTVVKLGSGQIIWVEYWFTECMKDPEKNSFVPWYLDAKKVVTGEEEPTLSKEAQLDGKTDSFA